MALASARDRAIPRMLWIRELLAGMWLAGREALRYHGCYRRFVAKRSHDQPVSHC